MKLKLAYFGTPYFSARFLEKLINDPSLKNTLEVKFAVTQPDKPVGRKQVLTKSSVKVTAEKYGVKIVNGLKMLHVTSYMLQEIDLALLYAYGEIIPGDILNLPQFGFLNIHPSLLPKYRGPSPIAYPLILGDQKTGVTIIKMDEKIDHGPIIAQEEIEISPKDRRPDLEIRLTYLAFEMFKEEIGKLRNWEIKRNYHLTAQADHLATYTHLLKKSDGFIPLATLQKAINNQPLAIEELPSIFKEIYNSKFKILNSCLAGRRAQFLILNLFRGLYPWPGIWTIINIGHQQKRLKITDLDLIDNKLVVKKVQLEGKKEVDFKTLQQAYPLF